MIPLDRMQCSQAGILSPISRHILCPSRPYRPLKAFVFQEHCVFLNGQKMENGIISISAHVRHHWSFMLHRTSRIDFTYFMLCSLLWRNPEGKVFWRKQREIVTFCLLSNPYPLLCRYQCKKKGTSQALFEKKHRHFLATKCSFQNTL